MRSKEHIVQYLPLGNIVDQDRHTPIVEDEVITLLYQALSALEYLHSDAVETVAHRDVKPANILVLSRVPFSIKLADFGLAKDSSNLNTFCGTTVYTAPEIYEDECYTTAVDMWSLGVVVYEYVYGLPGRKYKIRREEQENERQKKKESGQRWCQEIIDAVNDWEPDDLISLLVAMLVAAPGDRLSASECLKKAVELRIPNGRTSEDSRPLGKGEECPTIRPNKRLFGEIGKETAPSPRQRNSSIRPMPEQTENQGHAQEKPKGDQTSSLTGTASETRRESVYTEPSYLLGSFLPPLKDSFLCPIKTAFPLQPHPTQSPPFESKSWQSGELFAGFPNLEPQSQPSQPVETEVDSVTNEIQESKKRISLR